MTSLASRALTPPSTNRNGQVVVVTVAFTLVIVILCLITRLVMRWPWKKMMSRNDYFALGATTFAICNAAALCVAVRQGLGEKSGKLSESQTTNIRTAVLVAHLFYYLTASFAIASVVEFLFQIKGPRRVWPLDVLRVLSPLWGLAGVMMIAVFLGTHSNSLRPAAFITLATIACVIELATFAAAAMVTIPLQTSRSKRAHVLMGFSPSFVVIACFIASAKVLPTNALAADFTSSRIKFEIASELTLLFLIIYCTAAPLFQVGRRFQTGYNAPIIDGNHTMSGSNSGTRKYTTNANGTYGNGTKTSMNRSGHHGGVGETYDLGAVTQERLANKRYVSSVSAAERLDRERARRDRHMSGADAADGDSMASDSSQKIIIRRTVEQTSTTL